MSKRFNIYYLLLLDRQENPMEEEARVRVRRNVEAYYEGLRASDGFPVEQAPREECAHMAERENKK